MYMQTYIWKLDNKAHKSVTQSLKWMAGLGGGLGWGKGVDKSQINIQWC